MLCQCCGVDLRFCAQGVIFGHYDDERFFIHFAANDVRFGEWEGNKNGVQLAAGKLAA